MPSESFRDIPELFESSLEESLKARTKSLSTFNQLGPADLVHVVKTIPNARQHIKEVSSYHYVLGVDTSSSSSIAAYINSLTYSLEQNSKWLGLGGGGWNLSRSTFCCFNAFTGQDVRVEAKIPGGVKSFCIDALGNRQPTTAATWNEAFLSACLRSIFLAQKKCAGRRNLSALLSAKLEMKFLGLAAEYFERGWRLGHAQGPSIAKSENNFLTRGVVDYFCGTGRPEIAIGFIKQQISAHPSLSGLLFECFMKADQQGLAIQLATDVKADPSCFAALADFLITREAFKDAQIFAQEALKRDPLAFTSWSRLARIQIELGKFAQALMLINNAPRLEHSQDSFETKGRPAPAAISIPVDSEDAQGRREHASLALHVLERLAGNGLKGSDWETYELLVRAVKRSSWDELLACRSQVFLMEEEFAPTPTPKHAKLDEKDSLDFSNSPILVPLPASSQPPANLQFTEKKICERWLDRIFAILFEDLRVVEVFAQEMAEKRVSLKAGREFYLLGRLCLRLGRPESESCLLKAVEGDKIADYVEGALESLLTLYTPSNLPMAIKCALDLLAFRQRFFEREWPHPSPLSGQVCSLIRSHGLQQVLKAAEACVREVQVPDGVQEIFNEFIHYAKESKVQGYDL